MLCFAMLWMSSVLTSGALAEQDQTFPIPLAIPGEAQLTLTIDKSERRDGGDWTQISLDYDVALSTPGDDGLRMMTWELNRIDGKPALHAFAQVPSIRMTVDETLTPVGIDNIEEVVAAVGQQTLEPSDAGQAIRQIASTDPNAAAALFMKDARLAAVGQGTDLPLGQEATYEFEGVLPLGNAPVTMIGSYRLYRYDAASEVAEVGWSEEIEPSSLAKAMPSLLRSLLELSGAKETEGAEFEAKLQTLMRNARIDNSSDCTASIDTRTGLATKTECTQTVEISLGDQSRLRERRFVAKQRLLD